MRLEAMPGRFLLREHLLYHSAVRCHSLRPNDGPLRRAVQCDRLFNLLRGHAGAGYVQRPGAMPLVKHSRVSRGLCGRRCWRSELLRDDVHEAPELGRVANAQSRLGWTPAFGEVHG